MPARRFVLTLIAVALLSVLPSAAQANDPAGHWTGTWLSATNGHTGRINARVTQQDASTYHVHFNGTYLGLVPFSYSVPMSVTGQGPNGQTLLSGSARLPLFGNFCCQAEVTCCDFVASYNSNKDQGQFNMRRR